ncbi:MAG: ABC transporter permease [Acidobacteria bacterium]|nr:MAG: ABC transporter permease [Acidobacteriota bacterium]
MNLRRSWHLSPLRELRVVGRGLWRRRGLATMIVLPLALGIGATVAIYTAVQDVLLAPLDFPRPERLVSVRHSSPEGDGTLRLSPANYLDLESWDGGAFDGVAAYQAVDATLLGQGDPITLNAVRVTPSFFRVMAIPPALGRPFDDAMARVPVPAETILDHGAYVILGHGVWQKYFGGRASVVGETVTIDDRRLQVVGVMPEGFRFPAQAEIYLPLGFGEIALEDRGGYYLETVARLADGVTMDQAQRNADLLATRLQEAAPRINGDLGLSLIPLRDFLVDDLELGLWLLFATSALILLLVAANSAQLFLAHGLERQRDVAVRLALGAHHRDVVKRFLLESTALAFASTLLGLVLADLGLDLLVALAPAELFADRAVGLDLGSLTFALVVGLSTGVLVGLAPALYLSRIRSLPERLAEGGRSLSLGRGQKLLQDGMVVAQLSLAVVLVHVTYLMVMSYHELRSVPLGFDPEGVVTVDVTLPWERYEDEDSMRFFVERVAAELAAVPGVSAAGVGLRLPVIDSGGGIWIQVDPNRPDEIHAVTFNAVDPGFLRTLEVALLRGRGLEPTDRAGAPPVAVISRALAQRFFPGRDALGETLVLTPWPERRFEVVGIVEDVPQGGLKHEPSPAVYVPYAQTPMDRLRLVAKVGGDPRLAFPALRAAVWSVDPSLGIRRVATVDSLLETVLLPDRFSTTLLGIYGLFGAILAASGIFGVMAFFAESRRVEIGLRLALGGTPRDLIAWVVSRAAGRAVLGLGLGVAGALALGIAIADRLFRVEPWSPLPLALSLLSLLSIVSLAHFLPARRIVRHEPASVLHRA